MSTFFPLKYKQFLQHGNPSLYSCRVNKQGFHVSSLSSCHRHTLGRIHENKA
jgi:hypothetical protein